MTKALSIRQPYAWLIVAGHKPIENRTWKTTHRGRLLIHAAVKPHTHTPDDIYRRFGVRVPDELLFGGIIGEVELIDVVTEHRSPYFDGPYGFVLAKPRALPFRPLSGKQLIFEV